MFWLFWHYFFYVFFLGIENFVSDFTELWKKILL